MEAISVDTSVRAAWGMVTNERLVSDPIKDSSALEISSRKLVGASGFRRRDILVFVFDGKDIQKPQPDRFQ
jgi:hypothetical protein